VPHVGENACLMPSHTPSSSPVEVGIALALANHYSSSTAILGAMARIPGNAERTLVTRIVTTN
jgi:hypothetical protein